MIALAFSMLLSQSCETETICGFRYFQQGMCSFGDAYFAAPLKAYTDKQLVLLGDRPAHDVAAAVVVGNLTRRDAGIAFEVRNGPDHTDSLVEVDNETKSLSLSCQQSTFDTCSFVDNVGSSGHLALRRLPGQYLATGDRLGDNHVAVLPDGGYPNPANYPAGWVGTEPDGGTFFEYAGNHGGYTHVSEVCRKDGLLFDLKNPCTDSSADRVFFIDKNGGMAQHHELARWQFPPCPNVLVMTSLGQYVYGARDSTLLYAVDDMHWHACTPSGWKMLKFVEDD